MALCPGACDPYAQSQTMHLLIVRVVQVVQALCLSSHIMDGEYGAVGLSARFSMIDSRSYDCNEGLSQMSWAL